MAALQSDRRRALEKVVKDARDVAEQGARAALESLAVHHHEPHSSMTPAQRNLRARLRAHGKQLGDERDQRKGGQQIDRLVAECAYEHWHRMLFARFLAENDLLIEPESGAAVTLDECAELAKGTGRDAWEVAGGFAQRMLPQVFRTDDPALQVALSPETRIELEKLLASLPREVFLADDSLGWTYQFWQSAEKDRVNERAKAGEKITGRTLPAVTQLFTEHYMVLFLLHNTIGAWWAAKQMATWTDVQHAACADEFAVRRAVALPEYDFEYLRFVRDEATKRWRPAAGAFESWPREARELRVLDPCCGSGHFLVAAFDLLTRLREREEDLPRDRAALAVLEANIFGLELDPRCTQIAAFALAFAAWKRIGRVRELPPLRIACSGLSIHGERDEWAKLAGDNALLRGALESLHATFAQAPELGSLVDPRRTDVGGFKLTVDFERLLPLLSTALGRQSVQRDAEQLELGVAAQGLALAAELLAGSYTLIATNVPYLGRKSHSDALKAWADGHDTSVKDARNDLASLFVMRMLRWAGPTGTLSFVTKHEWLFLGGYESLRRRLLRSTTWHGVARLGAHAFETISGERVNVALVLMSGATPSASHTMIGLDASPESSPSVKAAVLRGGVVGVYAQSDQLLNPDSRVVFLSRSELPLLREYASSLQGTTTGDNDRFTALFWEQNSALDDWTLFQSRTDSDDVSGGRHAVLRWECGSGEVARSPQARVQGQAAFGRTGIAIGQTSMLSVAMYSGQMFDMNCAVLLPRDESLLQAIWAFVRTTEFEAAVRSVDQKLNVTSATLAKVPFDVEKWRRIASAKWPEGVPAVQSNDPTQWSFHGHPAGMLAGGLASASPLGIADPIGADRHSSLICREPNLRHVLHVAVARLVGYRWPAESDSGISLDIGARAWVERCGELARFADDDGVVPLVPMRNEPAADARVRELLRVALGDAWSSARESTLLAEAARANGDKSPTASLDDWLRNRFFEEHCALFHQRPFVWHIWDGRKKDGFGVLVHYHRLAAPNGSGRQVLEKITHGYLGDWITRQRDEVNVGKEGADARLVAALALQEKLTKILEGEPPFDIFARWKPLHQQPIGWEPDINDGVRINIRPFIEADVLRFTPKIKWTKDRGSEPNRAKADFPWFWGWDERTVDFAGGATFKGERFNDLHYTVGCKNAARARKDGRA
jgi:hypothetical protein